MTERDLLAVVAASLASSETYSKILRNVGGGDAVWPYCVKDAADLLAAVDAFLKRPKGTT